MKKGDMVMLVRSRAGNEGKIGTVVGPAPRKGDGWFQGAERVYVLFPTPLITKRGRKFNPAPVRVSNLIRLDPDALKDETINEKELHV